MKRLSLLLAGALALAACQSAIPMGTPSDDAAGKAFSPPAAGRGALYVYQGESSIVLDIAADQRVLGTLGGFSYLRTELPAGRYDVRAKASNVDVAALPVEIRAGDIRYVRAIAAPPAYSLREEPASVGQPTILVAKRVRDIKFLELPP